MAKYSNNGVIPSEILGVTNPHRSFLYTPIIRCLSLIEQHD